MGQHIEDHRLVIRAFVEADRASVVELWGIAFPNPVPHNIPDVSITRKLRFQPELFFVGLVDDVVVATTMAGYDGHRGWLYSVAVHPEHRRRGIATAIVHYAEDALGTMGCPKVNLQVVAGNEEVVGFYESLGYATEARISMGKRI